MEILIFRYFITLKNSITFYYDTEILSMKKASNNSLNGRKAYGSLIPITNTGCKRKLIEPNSLLN